MRVYIFALALAALGGCHNYLTPQDDTELGQYSAQLAACGKDPVCKQQVHDYWHAKWSQRFDGGF